MLEIKDEFKAEFLETKNRFKNKVKRLLDSDIISIDNKKDIEIRFFGIGHYLNLSTVSIKDASALILLLTTIEFRDSLIMLHIGKDYFLSEIGMEILEKATHKWNEDRSECNNTLLSKKQNTYLMLDSSTGYCKIGKSIHPEKREAALKNGNPTISLLAVCNEDIETELHKKYTSKNVGGEWFELSPSDIGDIISEHDFDIVQGKNIE